MNMKPVKYVFLDVVNYTGKDIEAQNAIVEALQTIVKYAVNAYENLHDEFFINTRYLPTGDGMCIAIQDMDDPDDIHVQLAQKILSLLQTHNAKATSREKFELRIGVNENKDIVYTDINGYDNYAGRGINYAQRVMSFANEGQIFVGSMVYEKLADRKEYKNRFLQLSKNLKNGELISVYHLDSPTTKPNDTNKKKALNKLSVKKPSNSIAIHGTVSDSVFANSIQTETLILKNSPKPKLQPPLNSIANDVNKRGYIKYLADRFNKWKAMYEDKGRMKYEIIWENIKSTFGNDAYMNSIDKFEGIAQYLKERIDGTQFGKINRGKGKRNYHSYEEHCLKGTDD